MSEAPKPLAEDRRGVAAVEFAIILPLMVTALFGSIELIEATSTLSRVELVAGSVADIASRDTVINNAEMNDLMRAVDQLAFPADANAFSVVVSRIDVTGPGRGVVVWSDGLRAAERQDGAIVTDLPQNVELVCPGRTILIAEAQARHQSRIGLVIGEPMILRDRQITCPRVRDEIVRVA